MTLDLGRSVLDLKGVGAARHRQLAAQGVDVVGDLLLHIPARYEDRRELTTVADTTESEAITLQGHLSDVRLVMRRGRRFSLVRGRLTDETGSIEVAWFNRPYLPSQVDESAEYLLHGRVRRRTEVLELQNPSCERVDRAVHSGRIVPVYSSLGPIGPALVRRLLHGALADRALIESVADPIPRQLRRRHGLPPIGDALRRLHLPDAADPVERLDARSTPAHDRLIYGELLSFHLRLQRARRRAAGLTKPHRVVVDRDVEERLEAFVPFELTGAQQRVVKEIIADLVSPKPMRRLLQGDVGSGKTIVAAAALVVAIENGLQGAFMAPTELLAEQHDATLRALLGDRYRAGLLTGSSDGAMRARRDLEGGALDLVVGTHALIEETVRFARLGLAVIDEQHRFGVAQRRKLTEKGTTDLLVMTATPIPRSLTLTAYGDLDLSVLDELPPGRTPVATEVLSATERSAAYDRVETELADGGRVFVVFPVIGEASDRRIPSLERGVEWLRRRLPEASIGVAHGQIPAAERTALMSRFAEGSVTLLAATTVIEVGVDVREASLMVIEGAERFGLAQLHQLRGRVGRGQRSSACVAIHGRLTDAAERRLAVFAGTTDGFEIAESDLEIRGPGEVLGTRQAGIPDFRVADLRRDMTWLERARSDARELFASMDETQIDHLIADLEWGRVESSAEQDKVAT